MAVILLVMSAVASSLIAVTLGGLLLPIRNVRSATISIPSNAEHIWPLISNPKQFPNWHDDISATEINDSEPLRWTEYGDDGAMEFEVLANEYPELFAVRSTNLSKNRNVERHIRLMAQNGLTEVTMTEHYNLYNPISRFWLRYVDNSSNPVNMHLSALSLLSTSHAH